MQKRALMKSTQVACSLSLNVVTRTDRGTHLATLELVQLTGLILFLWQFWQVVGRLTGELSYLVSDLVSAADFAAKVLVIGFKSLSFGLGVAL